MKNETKRRKYLVIEKAAYDLLAKKGYESTSMLSIAKASNSSNQTLYKWFGDKQGLFKAMVEENIKQIKADLDFAIENETDAKSCLENIAPLLLRMLVSDKAILLNRAAVGDPTGTLGTVLGKGGRETIRPKIKQLIERMIGERKDTNEATDVFLGVLIGDLQIRRATGAVKRVSNQQILARSERAMDILLRL